MKAKLYKDMTAQEQLQWVKDFTIFANSDVNVLVNLKTWGTRHRQMMERGLRLMAAFPYAQNYVDDALKFGDYHRRTYLLPQLVGRIKEDVSSSVAVTNARGETFAYVPQLPQTVRRRGRPTREEVFQRQAQGAQQGDVETEKQQQIARLLGLEVVTNPAGREKNNDELRAEREARAAAEAKMNPGLFQEEATVEPPQTEKTNEPFNVPFSDIAGVSPARLHLDQLAWLLSPELKERVATVRDLRSTAASYAEQAKTMALRGDKAEVIEPVAQLAAKYTELYEKIYDDVDHELATVCYRLKCDVPYTEKFKKRFGAKDVDSIIKQLKPYLQKMPPEFVVTVKTLIEQESPEYVAKVKAEKARKTEVEAIIKYLRRKDKAATMKRVETSRKKFARLVELTGAEQAEAYRPYLTTIENDYNEKAKSKEA